MKTLCRLYAAFALACASTAFYGCGGAGPSAPLPIDTAALGRVALTIHVAAATDSRSRQASRPGATAGIPTGAKALQVELSETGSVPFSQTQIVPAPTDGSDSTVQFLMVPAGSAMITVGAYGNIQASGSPLESGSATAAISPNTVVPVTVSLTPLSSVLTLMPAATTIVVNSTTNGSAIISASLATTAGAPITGFPLVWSVYNSTIGALTVDPLNSNRATVTGLRPGTVVVEAREPNTGVIGQATITVTM